MAILQEAIILGGNFPGGGYPRWQFSGWQLSRGRKYRVAILLGGNWWVAIVRVAIILGAIFLEPQAMTTLIFLQKTIL